MSDWRTVPARVAEVGDIVSVTGISNRRSVVMRVTAIDRTHEREVLVIEGRQPWGGGSRHALRHVHPEARAELYLDPGRSRCDDVLEVVHGGPQRCTRPVGHDGPHGNASGPWAR